MRSLIYQDVAQDQIKAAIYEKTTLLIEISSEKGDRLFEKLQEAGLEDALSFVKDPDDAIKLLDKAIGEILDEKKINGL